jgi:hypothetical protein
MKITVIWDAMACDLVDIYRRFGGKCCFPPQGFSTFLSLQGRIVLFGPEDGGGIFLRISNKYLPDYTALYPRRQ